MDRTVKEFRKSKRGYADVVVVDVRDILGGEYAVERLVAEQGGYIMVYSSKGLDKCLEKAQAIFDTI